MCALPGQTKTDDGSPSACYAKLGWDGSHRGKSKVCIPTANKRGKSLMVHYLKHNHECEYWKCSRMFSKQLIRLFGALKRHTSLKFHLAFILSDL